MVIIVVASLYFIATFLLVSALLSSKSLSTASRKAALVQGRLSGIRSPMESLGRRLPGSVKSGLERKLILAGSPKNMTVDSIVSLKIIISSMATCLSIALLMVLGIPFSRVLILVAAITFFAFFIPDIWINSLIKKRQKEIRRALPDTLDLLTISIEAGLGFDSALSKVVKNTDSALSDEFYRLLQEIQLGSSRKDAFKNLEERTDVAELNSFILAILQADVFGISIGKVLRVQSKEMRIKRRQRAEEMAMKAPVKIVFPLLLCIFPALNLVILGPAAIQIYNNMFYIGNGFEGVERPLI